MNKFSLKGWRTVIFNSVAPILPILTLMEWTPFIPDKYLPYYMLFVALVNIYLRKKTDTALGKSQ